MIKKIHGVKFMDAVKNDGHKTHILLLMLEKIEMSWPELIQSDFPETDSYEGGINKTVEGTNLH